MFNRSLLTQKLWKLRFVGSNWFFLKWGDNGKSNLSASECCQIYDLVGRKAVFRDGNTSSPQVMQEPQLLQAVKLAGGSSTHHESRHLKLNVGWTGAKLNKNLINPSSNGGVYRIAQLMLQLPSCNANISILFGQHRWLKTIAQKGTISTYQKQKMRPLIVVFHFRREWIFKSCFYHFHTFRSFALDYFRPLTHWVESRSRHARWGIQRTPTNIWSFSLELPTERAPQMWDLGMMQSSCCFGTNGIAATIARTRSHDGKKKSWKKYCRRTKDCKTVFVAFYTAVLTLRTAKRTPPLASRTAMPFLCH